MSANPMDDLQIFQMLPTTWTCDKRTADDKNWHLFEWYYYWDDGQYPSVCYGPFVSENAAAEAAYPV